MVNKELNPNFIRKCGVTYLMCRSSRPEVFSRKSVLRKFAKFTGKYPCLCLRAATLLKKRLWHRCFPVNFAILLRTPSFTEHLRWLLLNVFNFSFFWHFLIRYLLLTIAFFWCFSITIGTDWQNRYENQLNKYHGQKLPLVIK